MEIRTLEGVSLTDIHRCFLSAFADYVVPLRLSLQDLENMLIRRGYRADLSAGAFDGTGLAGFVLNGTEGTRGYNSGTGTIPDRRRSGLARKLMRRSIDLLAAAGVKKYWLEVIESNEPARRLYLSLGFEERRKLQCWAFPACNGPEMPVINAPRWDLYRPWWDIEPSWQNSTESVLRACEERLVLGNEYGYVVLFPASGDVAQLAVAPDQRRQGLGKQLLCAAARRANKALRLINIDEKSAGVAAFLEAAGARRTVRQLELVLPVGAGVPSPSKGTL